MSKKTFKSRNTVQVFLIIITAVLLITAIFGIVNLFKKSNDNSAKDGSVEKTYEETIEELTNSLISLTDSNNEYKKQIESLNSTISENEVSISVLQDVINNSTSAIASLNTEIEDKKNEIKSLENELAEMDENNSLLQTDINLKKNQITNLNSQVANLQTLVTQLQTTNDLNLKTIDTLNNQIQSLNSQISELQTKISNNDNSTSELNNKIASLEKSIEYYEQYISNLESETQVVATFEFDGSVYNIQILNKGAYASVVTPTSSDYVIFNYWTVDGQRVDLSSYPIQSNTKFVANTTYKYDVKFVVDNQEYNTQVVTKDSYATIPTAPTKTGYEFDGWSLNGVDIVSDINTIAVTGDTTYTAVFTKLHTVTFVYENETKATQSVRNGNYANNVTVENTTYKVFNGWLLNGTSVNISTYKIVADTVFVADVTYKYDVKFMVDDTEYNSQIVTANNYATTPANPTKNGYEFDGWSTNGVDIVSDINTIAVTGNTTYTAVFSEKTFTVTFVYLKRYYGLAAGNPSYEDDENSYNVYSVVEVKSGQTVSTISESDIDVGDSKMNGRFNWWCSDSNLENRYDFNTPITEDIVLYAYFTHEK